MQTKESIYETYKRTLCKECRNKNKYLCHITRTIDGKVKCIYYLKPERIKCKIPKINTTAKKYKPIMKGIC